MSQANVNAALVVEACRRYLSDRERKIEEKREKLIEECMSFPRVWRKLFGRHSSIHLTREEAIKELSSEPFSSYNMASCAGGYWADKIENVLSMAEIAMSTGEPSVSLDSEVASVLKPHFEVVTESCQNASKELFEARNALKKIGDLAHEKSIWPIRTDALWEIRNMAYEALKDKEMTR